ncbi:MAG: universal stress protein, partial [Prochlorothrix sp.]
VEASRALLHQAMDLGNRWNLPVHTQARVTHDVAQAILDTVRERNIDLTLMGWKGRSRSTDRVFGNTMDTLIRQAPSELVLVKLGQRICPAPGSPPSMGAGALLPLPLDRWLVPLGGGPNAQQALALLPSLISLSPTPEITLCSIDKPGQPPHRPLLLQGQQRLKRQGVTCPITTVTTVDVGVSDAILRLAETDRSDVIVLGASQDGLLQQTLGGNIPEAIARQSPQTVLVVRTRPEME